MPNQIGAAAESETGGAKFVWDDNGSSGFAIAQTISAACIDGWGDRCRLRALIEREDYLIPCAK